MHIHPSYNQQLASVIPSREELHLVQAKRAAETRRRLQAAAHGLESTDDDLERPHPVEQRASGDEQTDQSEGSATGKLFSAEA